MMFSIAFHNVAIVDSAVINMSVYLSCVLTLIHTREEENWKVNYVLTVLSNLHVGLHGSWITFLSYGGLQ